MKCEVLINHLRHDGKPCKAGDVIELDAAQARELERIGAVRRAAKTARGTKGSEDAG
ncbi:MAG: hypothetical protein KatS3mg119_1889 [Rhodothalassiaceae bacterium]|nr:MAG: hypothetical protein KatS3mg119_1889 [Rhodothalassiaceae bacterium]